MRGTINNRHNSGCTLLTPNNGPSYCKIDGALEIYNFESLESEDNRKPVCLFS